MITNAGAEHLEGFGSLEGVARAEGEMVAGLPADATAVINADDEFAPLWRDMHRRAGGDLRRASARPTSAPASVRTSVGAEGFRTRFRCTPRRAAPASRCAWAAAHNVVNALAAAAAAAQRRGEAGAHRRRTGVDARGPGAAAVQADPRRARG